MNHDDLQKTLHDACCGGPAPAGEDACCADDADAKAAGEDGCGCQPCCG